MHKNRILWADDEIDLLKPHILFLEDKGYEIIAVKSGVDALDKVDETSFDLVFLDENMPGMSGLETLTAIKAKFPSLPVVMITKSEEEHIMEEAIGSKIADYLIKPLNPNQILMSAKKLLDNERLITEKTNQDYRQEFTNLSDALGADLTANEWAELYRKLVFWELSIDQTEEKSMREILEMQKTEANQKFTRFLTGNYEDWMNGDDHAPMLSHQVLDKKVFPLVENDPVFLIVIDNLRYDQWEILEPEILKFFELEEKEYYYSILPTTTSYARNALFAGLTPLEISEKMPAYWVGEDTDDPKNNFEKELLDANLKDKGIAGKMSYHKIIKAKDGKSLVENVSALFDNDINAIVYNFVDMLSHARTDMHMIRELAPDESAYRSLTKSWFSHSSLNDLLKELSARKVKVVITTDHGTVRVNNPEKIVGDRTTNTNLRFKQGRNLDFDEKKVYFTRNPDSIGLPKLNVSTAYAFACQDAYFVYPNNYNHYVNHYRDTFQHGGISMEEIIVPLITLKSKS
ncbi:MAG: PglZ domain-containing protein [Cyclobacteriaceae bacterium]